MITIPLGQQLLAHTRGEARTAIADALERGETDVVVDASATTEVDGSGLGLLCRMNHKARDLGARLTIRHPIGELKRLLQGLHLDRILRVEYAPTGAA
jgi:anti-anti-sigma regulatory factor